MDDIKAGLQYTFQTQNKWTIAISGPGHLGMEAVLVNLLEPGESVLIGVNGLWGSRASETASRLGMLNVLVLIKKNMSFCQRMCQYNCM